MVTANLSILSNLFLVLDFKGSFHDARHFAQTVALCSSLSVIVLDVNIKNRTFISIIFVHNVHFCAFFSLIPGNYFIVFVIFFVANAYIFHFIL